MLPYVFSVHTWMCDVLVSRHFGPKTFQGKSSESVQCAITGPCLRMRHRPSA